MTSAQLLSALKKGKYAPLYFLQGTEPYHINTIIHWIENHLIPPEAKNFDLTTYYGQEITLQKILLQAKRFPMIAPLQVVLVKEAQHLQDLHRSTEQKKLLQYIESPNPQTLLLFAYKDKILDQRKTFTKQLKEKAIVCTTKKMSEKELGPWITDYVENQGYHIAPEATYLLETLIADNLQLLSTTLDKLILGLPKGGTLTLALVKTHVSPHKTFAIFDLQQAIQAHQIARTWEVVAHFSQHPKQYPLLPQVILLTNFFSKLLILHQLSHPTPAEIASKLRIPPYFARNYQAALRHYSRKKTIQNLHHLHQVDLQVKGIHSPAIPEAVLLKTVVAKLLDVSSL